MKSKIYLIILLACIAAGQLKSQNPVDKQVQNVTIKNPDGNDTPLPYIGKCVVAVFYTDPDNKDVNEPLSEAIKAKNYATEKYRGIGIGNCVDTWLPNAAIKMAARKKQAKYPNSTILLDIDHTVANNWNLGDCDNAGVVIIIGKDEKVKFSIKVKTQNESRGIINTVLKIIESEMK